MSRAIWVVVFLPVLLVSDLGCSRSHPGVGGETNWLGSCESARQCGEELTCLCGLCSIECELNKDCQSLGASAVCANASATSLAPACENEMAPSRGALCVLPCRKDDDCTMSSDVSLVCYLGHCVEEGHAAITDQPSEDAGTPSDAAEDGGTPSDASEDSGMPSDGSKDSSAIDGGADSAVDGGNDAGSDGGSDASPDSATDGGTDASPDRGTDGSTRGRPPCDDSNPCEGELLCHIDNTCIEPGVLDENGFATLAVESVPIRGIAVDDTYVYWTRLGTEDALGNHQGDGAVVRTPIEGGPITALVEPQWKPVDVVVDDSQIYWVSLDQASQATGEDEILSAAKDGSSDPRVLVTDIHYGKYGPGFLVQDTIYLYFDERVLGPCRVRKDGTGEVEQIAADLNPDQRFSFAADGEYVFLGHEYGVFRIAEDSLERDNFVEFYGQTDSEVLLFLEGDYLYHSLGPWESMEIERTPRLGGPSVKVLVEPEGIDGLWAPDDIDVHDGFLYFYARYSSSIEIGRAPVEPGLPEIIVSFSAEEDWESSVTLEATDKGLFWSQFLDAIPANRVTRFEID